MWFETKGCISFPRIHISIKIPHEGNKAYDIHIIVKELHSNYVHFLFPIHKRYVSFLSLTSFSWIRFLIKDPHIPAPASYAFGSPSALCDCVTDCLTLIVSPHPSVTLHQLSSDKPDQDKSLNKIWCPATTKREKWESVRCSLPCHSEKKESTEKRALLANEVKKDALLELLCGKGQSKHLQSVSRQKKKCCVAFLQKKWVQ